MPKCLRALIPALFLTATTLAAQPNGALQYRSPFMRVELAPDQPAFVALTVDSLGKHKLSANPLRPPAKTETVYQVRQVGDDFRVSVCQCLCRNRARVDVSVLVASDPLAIAI